MVSRLIFYYIISSLRLVSPPWRYFQLNAQYFNETLGIFSKLDIDKYIPNKWLLEQNYLTKDNKPKNYPLFLKPEWGQNSKGISIIHNLNEFNNACQLLTDSKIKYIVQELASGKMEFEIFYIQHPDKENDFATITITETINNNDKYPINSIYNSNTSYKDISHQFNTDDMAIVKKYLGLLPNFRIARVGIKTDSKKSFIAGDFKIIEINLFAPMPLNLLDNDCNKGKKLEFIKKNMYHLAQLSANMPNTYFKRFLFFKKLIHYYS